MNELNGKIRVCIIKHGNFMPKILTKSFHVLEIHHRLLVFQSREGTREASAQAPQLGQVSL